MKYLFRDHDTGELLKVTDLGTLFEIYVEDYMANQSFISSLVGRDNDITDDEYNEILEKLNCTDDQGKIDFLEINYNISAIRVPALHEVVEYETTHNKSFY
ncbi:hypothetical protein [Bacillus phage phiAGATE]|uniref:Uncharacterized protein n=1 Tax=Bacillus phage phiAGATE TaxID=1204533 RepID=L0L958_9CAUD|nr:hypothetical protein G380_gp018 [Bacillus phage phiAGATE]AGB62668.1 hypothetical protein [Bacillus phage phiAGATE]